jgi:AcrR family transcriptional regulator
VPYPSQVDKETIVQQAQQMIEDEGLDHLSLSKLAAALGVKAPSLYRHVGNKLGLLRGVNLLTLEKLFAAMDQAQAETAVDTPEAQLLAILRAYRQFAHANPRAYMLAMANNNDDLRPDEDLLVQMVLPIQEIMAAITGPAQSLAALRGALALVHGFVMLELTDQLRRGGDLTEAFEQATQAYLRGWQQLISPEP